MTIDKLITRAKKIKPTQFDDDTLLMWVNEIEGMVLSEVHLVSVRDLTPYEIGEDGAVPDAALTAPYPYDKLYLQYLLAQIDYANGEYSKYQNTMQMFNACYTEYVHYVAEVLAPADGRAELLQYYLSAYAIAKKHGYAGTEAQWLASLHGENGKAAQLRYQGKIVQWATEGAEDWTDLIDMQDIQDEITEDAQATIQAAASEAAATATAAAAAAKTAAEAAKASAQSAAQTATAASEAAEASAQDAASAKTEAAGSATTAAQKASAASASEQNAAESEQNAADSATAAETAAAEAESARNDAQSAAETANDAMDNATGAAQAAAAAEEAAEESAQDAEAWSVGKRNGQNVGASDPAYHNNAKYYADLLGGALEGGVASFNGRTGAVEPQKGDYTPEQVGALPAVGGTLTGSNRRIRNMMDPLVDTDGATMGWVKGVIPKAVSDLTDAADYAKKSDLASVYRYKGSVANYAALPTSGMTTGDVYNTEDDGMNYAWTGSGWDALGAAIEIEAISNDKIDQILAT